MNQAFTVTFGQRGDLGNQERRIVIAATAEQALAAVRALFDPQAPLVIISLELLRGVVIDGSAS